MEIFNIFPTPVGRFQIDGGITKEELDFVMSLAKRKNSVNSASVDSYVLTRQSLSRLAKFTEQCVEKYFDAIFEPKEDVKIYVTQSWVNYAEAGQHHAIHTHQNSIVSGVLYIQTNTESDGIRFSRPKSNQILIPNRRFNCWNSDLWRCQSIASELLLFPSSLEHMVDAVVGDQTRVSIAFNTFVKGKIGSRDSFTELVV